LPLILFIRYTASGKQIELIFKACKQSLNANRLTSNNTNIIENLLLASIAAPESILHPFKYCNTLLLAKQNS